MARGLWRCQKRRVPTRNTLIAPNSNWAKKGAPQQIRDGCGRWNAHKGRKKSKRVDTRCQYCGRRIAFYPIRKNRRGRTRSVHYIHFPDDTPLEALIEARDGLNSALPTPTGPLVVDLNEEGLPTGFTKARDLK